MKAFSLALLGVCCTAVVTGCEKKADLTEERGAAPPPVASSKPGVCASGGGTPSDKVSAGHLPRVAGDYCIDPNGETRSYGENAGGTLDKACTELFDGECEVYKGYGLKRVVTLRYVDGKGSPGSVNVNLSRFETKEGAYGFFTKRVIADADPVETAPAKLEAGGAGAIGTGIAYVWRGMHVAELSYTNELESPDRLKATSQRVLPVIATEVGEKLPGDKQLPAAALALPEADRVSMGINYDAKDVLGIAGAGAGAVGYYKSGPKRWRMFAVVRPDEDSAKDVMKTLKKLEGAKGIKNSPIDALAFSIRDDESSPKADWIITRLADRVYGIGDEEHVLGTDKSKEEAQKVSLTQQEKLDRLRQVVQGGAPAGATTGDSGALDSGATKN